MSLSQLSLVELKCETPNCPFYMSVSTQPYCHECFEQRKKGNKLRRQNVRAGSEKLPATGTNLPEGEPHDPVVRSSVDPGTGPRSAPPTAPSLFLYSETTAMKCRTPDCPFTMNVQYNGLCERCYNSGELSPGSNPEEAQRSDCVTCTFCLKGTKRTFNGMCSTCFKRARDCLPHASSGHQRSSSDPSHLSQSLFQHSCQATSSRNMVELPHVPPQRTEERKGSSKCRKPGCSFFGTPQNEGFCTICYFDYRENKGESRNYSSAFWL